MSTMKKLIDRIMLRFGFIRLGRPCKDGEFFIEPGCRSKEIKDYGRFS